MNGLAELRPNLVRILPLHDKRMDVEYARSRAARKGWDFRTVCECQRHAAKQQTLARRAMRGIRTLAREIKRRSIPIALTLPLAFSALYPIDAMNLADGLVESSQAIVPASELRIVTPRIRRQFLRDERQAFTVAIAKEQFFRTEVPYGAVIYDEAIRNGFAPELIAAVIETESDFRPKLRSNKEALGLMQIVPETGRLMGARDLLNPHENVRAGVKYLRYLSDRFDGNMKMVLAAYNAGEGNVARFGGVPPFRETVDYLQRVSTRKLLYQRRIGHHYVAALKLRGSVATE
jgi:soluble lytic murein transglycosylase-like protein